MGEVRPRRRGFTADNARIATEAGSPGRAPARYEARFFGPFRVLRDGIPLSDRSWGRARAQTLLKWFLLHPGQSFGAAELAALLWPGGGSANYANKLHVTVHALRRVLEPGLPSRRPSTFISLDQGGRYRFELRGQWWTDVGDIERLWASTKEEGESGDAAGQTRPYERLLSYYRQGFLPEDIYDDAFAPHRAMHDRRHDEALQRMLSFYRGSGLAYEALTCALEILNRDPYVENAITAIVEVHLDRGDAAAALSHLDRFIATVKDDLGVPPSEELLDLHTRIRSSR